MVLILDIPEVEFFDEETQEFISLPATTLRLEHSLEAISKWESKWKKPLLVDEEKTVEQTIDYIKCMTIDDDIPPETYRAITSGHLEAVRDYMTDPMTATTFPPGGSAANNGEFVTSELIYYWMVSYGLPFEVERWHINRLLTLIRVCGVKSAPAKKMTNRELAQRQRELNEARKKTSNSKG